MVQLLFEPVKHRHHHLHLGAHQPQTGGEESHDFNNFQKRVKKANKALGLKRGAPQLKQILDAVSRTDP
jgi:hypothetical protein